jgi:hypothetical protein
MRKPLLLTCLALLWPLPGLLAQRGPVPGFNASTPYLIYYGTWDAAKIASARLNYRLVILHPSNANLTAANIATIRSGPNGMIGDSDDVKVLAYISVGEDDRPIVEGRPGAPFPGDNGGPRVDPRSSSTLPLAGINPLGAPSPGGTGFASYYLDDGGNAINGTGGDGQPDRNATFGGYFVNPGDPAWFDVIKSNTIAVFRRAGLDELLTTTTGAGFGCDGVFLDTVDTPAPNSFGATLYEWTAPAYQALVKRISDTYPAKLILANRGIFFYNPNLKTYEWTLRPYVNMVMFESYYSDSSGSGLPTAFFDDNKYNYAPKINAEAARPDGFTVLALGYNNAMDPPALEFTDFFESQQQQGWMLYRTNPALTSPFQQDAAAWNAANPDSAAPVWDTTAATGPAGAAVRVGVQQVRGGNQSVTLRWDVARDQTGPVKYNVYYTTAATLDFATATRINAVPVSLPASYRGGAGAGRYPFEYTITGLTNGVPVLCAVRAADAALPPHEEDNIVVLGAVPAADSEYRPIVVDGSFTDWAGAIVNLTDSSEGTPVDYASVSVANDATRLFIRFSLHAAAQPFSTFNTHLFIDADNNPATGFQVGGASFGSELMVEGSNGYDQRAGGFNAGIVSGLGWVLQPLASGTEFELQLNRAAVYANGAPVFPGNTFRLLLQDNRGDTTGLEGLQYSFAPAPPPTIPSYYANIAVDGNPADWAAIPSASTDAAGDGTPDIVSMKLANDENWLYVLIQYAAAADTNAFNGSPSNFLSIDNDANPTTGFNIYGLGQVGAEVSWQNDFAFAQNAATYNLGAVFTGAVPGIAPYAANTSFQEYRIARSATYTVGGGAALPVFPQNTLRLAAWSNSNVAAEFAGGVNYAFASPPVVVPTGYFALINVDGAAPDWAGIPALASRSASGAPMDWSTLQLANDRNFLYGRFTLHAAPAAAPFSESPTNLFIDTDSNSATGFAPTSTSLGSALMVQGGVGYDQRGGGFNEGTVNGVSWFLAGSGTAWEFRVARAAVYAGGAAVFPQADIKLALQDDRPTPGTVLGAGGIAYRFQPDPLGNAYNTWRAASFTPAQLANALISGSTADPDNDGAANFAEFAFGRSPLTSDAGLAASPGLVSEGGNVYPALTILRRRDADGVLYVPAVSDNLTAWDENPVLFVRLPDTMLPGNVVQTTYRLTEPVIPGQPRRFLRVAARFVP